MKRIHFITSALVALGIASQAWADPTVYLTGSTAFRSTLESALSLQTGPANGGVFDAGSVTYQTWGSSSAGSANYMVFHGTIGGSPLYIDCAWSGSEAGIASACDTTLGNKDRNDNAIALNGSPEVWIDVSNATVVASLSASPSPISTNPPTSEMENGGVANHGSDLTQADTSQAVSWTSYVPNTVTALKDYGTGDGECAVTFTWIRNLQLTPTHEWLDCTNLTLPQINQLFSTGYVPAGFISGNPNDDDMNVYLVGRNLGSGTRMNALSTSQYGGHNTIHQFSIGYGVESYEPQNDDVLWLTNEANGGYESGGGVVKAMTDTGGGTLGSCQQADPTTYGTGNSGWLAVAYASPADALSSGNNGGVPTNDWCSVDGVFSNNQNIENGSWWMWGHEHLYGKYQISGIQDTVGNAIFNAVQTIITTALYPYGQNPGGHDPGIPWGLMNVSKGSDTAFPTF